MNLGPGINEMLSKRKPSPVNIPLDLMRILCPASPITSCMTLVQRPQRFSTVVLGEGMYAEKCLWASLPFTHKIKQAEDYNRNGGFTARR